MEKKSETEHLRTAIEAFKIAGQTEDTIFESGITFLLSLYGASEKITCINKFRYLTFAKAVATNTKTLKAVKLENLPPTADAARQHFYRVYLQVQKWMSCEMNPEDWGWERDTLNDILKPIEMKENAAPEKILKMIFCSCTSGCIKGSCTCRKSGLKCAIICKTCSTENCKNLAVIVPESEDEDEDSDDRVDDGQEDEIHLND